MSESFMLGLGLLPAPAAEIGGVDAATGGAPGNPPGSFIPLFSASEGPLPAGLFTPGTAGVEFGRVN